MISTRRDLTAMLRPRSIALVGATDRSRWSQNTFDNLINRKYPGKVYLVSRRGGTVHGRSAAISCGAVGAPIASDVTPIAWPRPNGDLPQPPAPPDVPEKIRKYGVMPGSPS